MARNPARINTRLDSVAKTFNAFALGAMLATVKCAALLQAMPDNANSTMSAGWCERMNGAFEAVEGMRLAAHRDLKRLVVVIAAGFTCSHDLHLRRHAADVY
jgi:hypothetical protein